MVQHPVAPPCNTPLHPLATPRCTPLQHPVAPPCNTPLHPLATPRCTFPFLYPFLFPFLNSFQSPILTGHPGEKSVRLRRFLDGLRQQGRGTIFLMLISKKTQTRNQAVSPIPFGAEHSGFRVPVLPARASPSIGKSLHQTLPRHRPGNPRPHRMGDRFCPFSGVIG